jgi:type II secretory pathway component GspD/PulD (secretin)
MSTASETRLRRGDEGGASGAGEVVEGVWLSQADPVGAWLDVLMGLVRLGNAEKRAIRDELDSHLRDRVRDLMLTGLREQVATREAIGELGDAAELAARYARASKSPARRRIAMNLGLFGMAGAALVTSFVAMQQPGGSGGSGPEARAYQAPALAAPEHASKSVGKVAFTDTPLGDVLRHVSESAGLMLQVDERSLESIGLMQDSPVTMSLKDATLQTVMDELAAWSSNESGMGLSYRVRDGVLRVAGAHDLDLADRMLVTIDVSGPIESGISGEEICELVQTFIEPDSWETNGGDLGRMNVVGTKMFIRATPRMIEGTRWIVGQLAEPEQARAGDALGADEYVRVFKLSHVSAATMLAAIEPIYAAVAERTDPEAARLRFTADKENPVIVVRGPKRLVEEACAVMSDMDAAKETGQVQSSQVQPGPKAAIDSRLIPLKNVGAMEMAEVLRAAGSVSERLRKGPPERAIAVDAGSNGLYVRSTAAQIDAIAEIVGAFDTDGPLDDRAIEESRTIKLERARAAELRQVLGLVLNANSRMKQCQVPRSFEVDASENTLTVTATPGQVDAIARMVSALDAGL